MQCWRGCGTDVDEFEEKAQMRMGLDVWVQCLGGLRHGRGRV